LQREECGKKLLFGGAVELVKKEARGFKSNFLSWGKRKKERFLHTREISISLGLSQRWFWELSRFFRDLGTSGREKLSLPRASQRPFRRESPLTRENVTGPKKRWEKRYWGGRIGETNP